MQQYNTERPLSGAPAPDADPSAGGERSGEMLFTPDSQIYRVQREALVLLAGGRAILMQLAHPLVAAGVADYSTFQSDPLSRLFRTLHFMHTIVFDDQRRPQTLHHFHRMHARIQGRLSEPVGTYPAGTPYAGDDPELKLWVHATFIDSCLLVYERFVHPLSQTDRHRFYEDSLKLGRLMEIPEEVLPPTLPAFQSYMKRMIAGDALVVDDMARCLADGVLYPEVSFVPRMSAGLLRLVTTGILPETLRRAFALPWSRSREILLRALSRTTRRLRPHVGPSVWKTPLLGGSLAWMLLWGASGATPSVDAIPEPDD